MIYVDDTFNCSKDHNKIQSTIDSLKSEFVLTDERDVNSFLGVKLTHHKGWDNLVHSTIIYPEYSKTIKFGRIMKRIPYM